MAKAVANKGLVHTITVPDLEESSVEMAREKIYTFIDEMREKKPKLSSCILFVDNDELKKFENFEEKFWDFLQKLNLIDKKSYSPDPDVSSDPNDGNFSYSIKSESFFIVTLHPESPRWARRFEVPAIVFNPHKQFEEMRKNGNFTKVRDLIRMKDKLLQGSENPMLQNFGEKSEVFQYLGKLYQPNDPVPLRI